MEMAAVLLGGPGSTTESIVRKVGDRRGVLLMKVEIVSCRLVVY